MRGGKVENTQEDMFGGVMCGGGFVYGVFVCGGQGKGRCTFFAV